MEHPLNVIGPQIRALRETAGLTQEQLAARCQRLGLDITRGTLAKIEASVRSVGDHEIPFIARALASSLDALFPKTLIPLRRKPRNPHGAQRKTQKDRTPR
ncbi:MAG: helix-turn-helix transcriptional regulator [Verrucomicrobiota bacterium]